jgi:hypothetical protein
VPHFSHSRATSSNRPFTNYLQRAEVFGCAGVFPSGVFTFGALLEGISWLIN